MNKKHCCRADSVLDNCHWRVRERREKERERWRGRKKQLFCFLHCVSPGPLRCLWTTTFWRGKEHPWVVFTFPAASPKACSSAGQLGSHQRCRLTTETTVSCPDGILGKFWELIIIRRTNGASTQWLSDCLCQILRTVFPRRHKNLAFCIIKKIKTWTCHIG